MNKVFSSVEDTKSSEVLRQLRKRTKITANFLDEEIGLVAETTVGGDEEKAAKYAPIFEKDIRENFKPLFPQPKPEEPKEPIDFIEKEVGDVK